jgi:hypothetical protein
MRPSSPTRGFSVLEFAITLAALLPLIFGAVDIANSIRAYNAIAKGSETALRCLYPTDGACMEAANLGPTRLFNWFDAGRSSEYFVRDVAYRGHGEWLTFPTYTFDTYRARVLSSVSFEIPRYNATVAVTRRQISTPVSVWVRRTGLPAIRPLNAANPLGRDVRFVYNNEREVTFPSYGGFTHSGESVVSTGNPTATITLNLTNPLSTTGSGGVSSRAIFKARSGTFDTNNALPVEASAAIAIESEPYPFTTAQGIPAIVYVKGTLSGQPVGLTSKLNIAINGNGLGGQVMQGGGAINFYPRGVGGGMPNDSTRRIASTTREFLAHEEWDSEVWLRPGANTIEISRTNLDRNGNSVFSWGQNQTWTVTDVEVYLPRFSLRTFNASCEQASCSESPCSEFRGVPVSQLGAPAQYPSAFVSGALSSSIIGTETVSVREVFSSAEVAGVRGCDASQVSLTEIAPLIVSNRNCPENFGGISTAAKMQACPPVAQELTRPGATVRNISWSSAEISVPRSAEERAAGGWERTFAKRSCETEFTFDPPPALARFAEIITPTLQDANQSRTVRTPIGGVNGRPREVKAGNSSFSCQEIELAEMEFDGQRSPRTPRDLADTSLFVGLHPERATSPECQLNLRNDAEANGLPPEAWFRTTASPVREVRVAQRPTNSCILFRSEVSANSTPEQVATLLPEGETPPICAGRNCTRAFAGIAPGTSGQDQATGPDTAMAQRIAFDATVASYPHAMSRCEAEAANCLKTEVSTDNDVSPTSVSVRNSIKVPLNLLGGRAVTISNTQSRELERSFVGR